MDERLAACDRNHRRARSEHPLDRVVDAHALLQDLLGKLDLPAARALEIALEERFELDDQRELVAARDALLHEVGAHACELADRNAHSVVLL